MGQDAFELVRLLGSIQGTISLACVKYHKQLTADQRKFRTPMIRNRNIFYTVGEECVVF